MARNKQIKKVNVQRTQDRLLREETKLLKDKPKQTQDSFQNFEMNLGIGSNNPMSSSTYGFNPITRNRTLLEWIYRGSWLGGVACDIKADDMTRGGVDILGELDPDNVQAIEEEAVRLGIWNSLNETLKWSALYGGAIAVLLIDGQDNETPLRLNTIREGQFCGLLSMDRWMVEPSLFDLVTDYGPSLGLPKYYRVTAMAPALVNQRIHYSRVIRFDGIKLPYWQKVMENLWGISVLERMYDRMIAFDSATTGAAQLVYKSYIRNYKIKGLRQIVAAGGDALTGLSAYVDMMRRFQGIEGMTLLDSEDEYNADSHGAFGGLSDILMRFMEQCSGALQIPLVRLFGQSPSGFSTGDTDLRNYYDTIRQGQEKDLKVGVTKIYRAMASSLGQQVPEGFGISFRSLWQLTDIEKSDIAGKNSDTISKAEESGLVSRYIALKELKQQSKVTGIFTNITEEDIDEAENEPPPIPEDVEIAEIKEQGQVEASEIKANVGANSPVPSGGRPTIPTKETKQIESNKAHDFKAMAAAGIMFMNESGEILLLKRALSVPAGNTWGLPGGTIEGGENAEMAARREAIEETGIVYNGPLMKIDEGGNFTTFTAFIPGDLRIVINSESQAYMWINPNNIPEDIVVLHPNLKRVLDKLGY